MKDKSKIIGVLVVVVFLSGCAISPKSYKGYRGPDMAPEKVALVKLAPGLVFVGTDTFKPEKPRRVASVTLLPGMNIIKIGSISNLRVVEHIGNVTESMDLGLITKFGGYRVIDMNVEAGHTYFIASEFKKLGSYYVWRTPVTDTNNGTRVEAIIYDGMLKFGTTINPWRRYHRK